MVQHLLLREKTKCIREKVNTQLSVMSVLRILSVANRAIGRCTNRKLRASSFVSQMNLCTSDETKFHPPHPTVMQRLIRIEDKLRFRGYSVLRIGFGILLVGGKSVCTNRRFA